MSILSYRGIRTWPPTWLWRGEGEDRAARGEVGVLKEVRISVVKPWQPGAVRPYNRIYLFMEYLGSAYIGCLILDDPATCLQIGRILAELCGRTMREIGDIDLEHLL